MKVYRISQARLEDQRASQMMRWTWMMTIMLGGSCAIALSGLRGEKDLRIVLGSVLLLGTAATVGVFKGARKARLQWDELAATFELVLDADGLTRRQKSRGELFMKYLDVRQIEEMGSEGIRIKGDPKQPSIWIPAAVEGYDQLKADLALLTAAEISKKNSWSALASRYLSMIFVLVLGAMSFLAQNKLVAAAASFVLGAIVIGAIITGRRSPNLPKEANQGLLWAILAAVFALGRGLILLLT